VKRATLISAGLVGLFVGLALARADAAPPVLEVAQEYTEAARPGGDLTLLTRLNGTPTPYQLPDGGMAGFSGSGIQCLRGWQPGDVLKFTPNAEVWVCPGSLDGGCQIGSTAPLDPNAGDDAPASQAYYLVLPDAAPSACDAGSVNCQSFTSYFTTASSFSSGTSGYRLCIVPTTGSVAFPIFKMQ
jgi:hypothetical protein